MKKIKFYTRKLINKNVVAVPVVGYTDGTFNYYKDEFKHWYAIHPSTGLAVSGACVYTRKLASTIAHEHFEKVARFITERGAEESAKFTELVATVDAM